MYNYRGTKLLVSSAKHIMFSPSSIHLSVSRITNKFYSDFLLQWIF